MSINPKDRKARANYKRKVKKFQIEFYPTEADLIEHIEKQPKKQTYIKDLIRKDMLIIKSAQSIELTTEEQQKLCVLTATMEKERAEAFAEYYKRQIYKQRNKKEG
jgi:hypothetical protein